MKWIAITGGIASGKTKVGEILKALGYAVVDADELAREAVGVNEPGYNQLIQAFGLGVVKADGEIDRTKLGAIVFAQPSKLQALEKILHPLIQRKGQLRREKLQAAGHAIAFYLIPLLYEKNLQNKFDQTVVVYCPENLQRQRLQQRNQFSAEEVDQRLRAQMPIDEKRLRADYVIENQGSLSDLEHSVLHFLSQGLGLSKHS